MNSLYHALLTLALVLVLSSTTALAQDAVAHGELPRFEQVSERLYRGAQPQDCGIHRLHELGINTVVNLRGTSKRTKAEEAEARALGLNYFNIGLPNWGRPQDARVRRIIEIIAAPESGRVFIHCKDGVDRTGTIVAIHRMTHEAWSSDDALEEADRYGMRRIQFWMRDYIEDYGQRVSRLGPETAAKFPKIDKDFGDRVGIGVRVMEQEAFRARKVGGRFLQNASGGISDWLRELF